VGAPPATRTSRPVPSRPRLWRVTDRAGFAALARDGRRARHAGITVTRVVPHAGATDEPPRVALAVSRAVGGAVARNRVRRRLRAAMAELTRRGAVPGGTYLVGGSAELADRPWESLVADLEVAVARSCEDRPR
jgi:ribonuclease P protein component